MGTLEGVQTIYPTPGLRAPVLRATDDRGAQYIATTGVNGLDRGHMDSLLQDKWTRMKAALQADAIEGALGFFLPSQQGRYRTLFTLLRGQLAQIVADMESIQLVYLV